MKTIFLILLSFLLTVSSVNAQDSLSTMKLNDSLLVENMKLKHKLEMTDTKVDALQSSTDRILTALYVTIGFILTSVFGLSIWNWIGLQRKNKSEFQSLVNQFKSDINNLVNSKIDGMASKDSVATKQDLKSVKSDLLQLEILLLEESLSKYVGTNHHHSEYEELQDLLKLSIKLYDLYGISDFHLRNALEGWKAYLSEKEPYVYRSTKDELIQLLSDSKFRNFSDAQTVVELLKSIK